MIARGPTARSFKSFLKELQRSSESDALQRSASDATAERVRDGADEIFTIRLSAARVNMERCKRASSAIT